MENFKKIMSIILVPMVFAITVILVVTAIVVNVPTVDKTANTIEIIIYFFDGNLFFTIKKIESPDEITARIDQYGKAPFFTTSRKTSSTKKQIHKTMLCFFIFPPDTL